MLKKQTESKTSYQFISYLSNSKLARACKHGPVKKHKMPWLTGHCPRYTIFSWRYTFQSIRYIFTTVSFPYSTGTVCISPSSPAPAQVREKQHPHSLDLSARFATTSWSDEVIQYEGIHFTRCFTNHHTGPGTIMAITLFRWKSLTDPQRSRIHRPPSKACRKVPKLVWRSLVSLL